MRKTKLQARKKYLQDAEIEKKVEQVRHEVIADAFLSYF